MLAVLAFQGAFLWAADVIGTVLNFITYMLNFNYDCWRKPFTQIKGTNCLFF